jgi:hypothetical protein
MIATTPIDPRLFRVEASQPREIVVPESHQTVNGSLRAREKLAQGNSAARILETFDNSPGLTLLGRLTQ